jgi:hypothetical protein
MMTEVACTIAMVAIIGALFVGFVSNSIANYKNDKQSTITSKTIEETFNGNFEKDLRFKMKISENQNSDIFDSSFFGEILKFIK